MSKPRWPHLRRVAASVALLAAVAPASATPAAAVTATSSDGPCPTASGITVVVDFHELGGSTIVRCATGTLDTGLAVLDAAGIEYRTAVRSPGFVCRISNVPATDPCVNTSPTSAYWSYWLAARGGTWCYSGVGAGNRAAVGGTVEGWSFSLNRTAATAPAPGIAVPPPVAGSPSSLSAGGCHSTAPPTTVPHAPPTTAGAASPTPAVPSPKTPRPAPGPTPSDSPLPGSPPAPGTVGDAPATPDPQPPGTATAPTVTPTDGGGAAESASPAPSSTVGATPVRAEVAAATTTRDRDPGGSPAGAVVAALLLAGLVGAAIVIRRRARAR